jgi:hypothetical protein
MRKEVAPPSAGTLTTHGIPPGGDVDVASPKDFWKAMRSDHNSSKLISITHQTVRIPGITNMNQHNSKYLSLKARHGQLVASCGNP